MRKKPPYSRHHKFRNDSEGEKDGFNLLLFIEIKLAVPRGIEPLFSA